MLVEKVLECLRAQPAPSENRTSEKNGSQNTHDLLFITCSYSSQWLSSAPLLDCMRHERLFLAKFYFHARYNYAMVEALLYTLVQCSVHLMMAWYYLSLTVHRSSTIVSRELRLSLSLQLCLFLPKPALESDYWHQFIHVKDSAVLNTGLSSKGHILATAKNSLGLYRRRAVIRRAER